MNIVEIPKTGSSFSIETPVNESNKAIIFLPGISGGAFSERFRPFVDEGNKVGFTVARISAWKNGKNAAQKSLETIYSDVAFVISYLQEHGYVSVSAVGKSFGGTILLTLPLKTQNMLNREVLWSPIIGVDHSPSNVENLFSVPLEKIESLKDILVDTDYLQDKKIPFLIIHGDADENIELSNSEKLASLMPDARVLPIEGADHSFSGREHQEKLVSATFDFLIQ